MSAESTQSPASREQVADQQEDIAASVCRALRGMALSNRLLIRPRRLDEIGREETQAFLEFLHTRDEVAIQARGQRLALEGLGNRSILEMTEALRYAYSNNANPVERAAGRYVVALLEGYMVGSEQELLREQERTLKAYERARELQEGQ